MNQEEFAATLGVSLRTYQNKEKTELDLSYSQFILIQELLGQHSEDFWLLFLETDEHKDYRLYRKLRWLISENSHDEAKEILKKFDSKRKEPHMLINQFLSIARIKLNMDLSDKEAIDGLWQALSMTKANFEEANLKEYRLTFNEIAIISEIAVRLYETEEKSRAITMLQDLEQNIEESFTTEEDRALLLPPLLFDLSNMLGDFDRNEESIEICEKALRIGKSNSNFRFHPKIHYNMARRKLKLGEERCIWEPLLVRAYQGALMQGDGLAAKTIKEDANTNFGISLGGD